MRTPVLRCPGLERARAAGTEVYAKLEFLQRTGTFKARGALAALGAMESERRANGVTAVSAGNHAIAVAYAAQAFGIDAKLVMLSASNPARVERCRELGAELVFAKDVHTAFAVAEQICRDEGRHYVHPFEGASIVRGTATLGLEIVEQIDDVDTLIVPVGGGGLCAGVSAAVKQLEPRCRMVGVEPFGAASMHESFARGMPAELSEVTTIADSLGAPHAMPETFALCRQYVDELVRVTDDELRAAMRFLFEELHIAVEPACAATTAALHGPLKDAALGRRVAIIMCGSNIDWTTYEAQAFST